MLPVFKTENSPLQIYFLELELHVEILMQQLSNSNQKICCWFSLCPKIISLKKVFGYNLAK